MAFNLIGPSVAFHTETSHLFRREKNEWFLYEMHLWAEMDYARETCMCSKYALLYLLRTDI